MTPGKWAWRVVHDRETPPPLHEKTFKRRKNKRNYRQEENKRELLGSAKEGVLWAAGSLERGLGSGVFGEGGVLGGTDVGESGSSIKENRSKLREQDMSEGEIGQIRTGPDRTGHSKISLGRAQPTLAFLALLSSLHQRNLWMKRD